MQGTCATSARGAYLALSERGLGLIWLLPVSPALLRKLRKVVLPVFLLDRVPAFFGVPLEKLMDDRINIVWLIHKESTSRPSRLEGKPRSSCFTIVPYHTGMNLESKC